MIMRALVEGLKSVIVRSLTSPSESNQVTPLSMVFIGGVAGISLILAEVFFGLSMYKALRFDCGYGEGLSMLMAALVYVVQMIISILIVRHHFKRMVTENVMVKEYKLVKGVFSSLIDGYKSK